MNATGESDMQNYYNIVEQKQTALLEPVLDKLLPIMFVSEFGAVPDDLDYTFNPMETPSDDDLANIVQKKADVINKAYTDGIIGRKTALKEYRQMADTTGMFSNITDEIIDSAEDDVDIGDMPPLNNDYVPYDNGNDSLFSMDTDPKSLSAEILAEQEAIDQYEADIQRSVQQGDWEAVVKLKEILKDEEDHKRILEELKKKRGW
jgi:hypothetical protein